MKMSLPYRLLWASLAAIIAASLSSCGTVEGFGKDLQSLGRKMENASDDVQGGGDGGRY